MNLNEQIGIQKAIIWEEAKGKLRAMVAASGQVQSSVSPRSPDWRKVKDEIESFIKHFENNGFHE